MGFPGERKMSRGNGLDMSSFVYGKVPPHSDPMEQAVLGTILLEKNALSAVYDILFTKEIFYKDPHQRIFSAMLRIHEKGNRPDTLTVVEELKKTEDIDICGGPAYLFKLENTVVNSTNLLTHSFTLIEHYIKREIIKISGEYIQSGYLDSTESFDLVQQMVDKLERLNAIKESFNVKTSETLAVDYIKNFELKRSNPEAKLKTGMSDWDRINGELASAVYVVAARPGMGKTSFIVEFLKRFCEINQAVFFNLEMTDYQIVQRFIGNIEDLSNDEFKYDDSPEFTEKVYAGMQKFVNLKLDIVSQSDLTIESIYNKAKHYKETKGAKVVVIDYLQIIPIREDLQKQLYTDVSMINHNLAKIQQLANKLDMTVILLSQLNRDTVKRGGSHEPVMADLKGSGKIEEVAFQISFLHRPEYYDSTAQDEHGETLKGLAYQIIVKHRDGILDRIKYKFEGSRFAFKDWPNDKVELPGMWSQSSFSIEKDDMPF